ncbi:serine protease [Streptomyces avicenniae]|uniref:serine protease n=1 Tax=Streptomyces avicenniae TaxID=500153 RepID=UPI00069C715D|nr:serine protease [Streptomyces avicenniae]
MTASADGGGNGLVAGRVAEIIARRAGGGSARGSGYLIAPGRVLTAAHVVPEDAAGITVRFDADLPGERTAAAAVAWRHRALDIAVLTYRPADGAEDGVAPAVVGRVGEFDGEVPFSTLGFPLLSLREDGTGGGRYRDTHQLTATFLPLSNRREGTFDLAARPVAQALARGGSAWEGMSGAPVFSRGLLIGVVVAAHRSPGEERLTATRIDRWADRLRAEPEALATLGTHLGADLAPGRLPDVRGRLARTPATPSLPDALADPPPPPAVFRYRDAELAAVLDALRPGAAPVPSGRALAVTGPAGVGKTSLAAQAAAVARREGWFPGGFLYADLLGHRPQGPGALTAEAILRTLLRALLPGTGGDVERYNLNGLAALFRDALRERGDARGPVLVLLDNAPPDFPAGLFLPGGTRHRLLLTARTARDWSTLPLLRLGPLERAQSRALLAELLRGTGVPLEGISEGEFAEIAALCEDLPLALAVAAGRLRDDTGHGAGPLLTVLREPGGRLAELDMRAVYAATYGALDERDARLFRLLALHPGGAIDGWSAAALLGVPDAADALRRLHRAELLQRTDGEGRFRLHDLLRAYAEELLGGTREDERAAALDRLLTRAGELAARGDADWLTREEGTLLALLGTAAEAGATGHVETLGPPLDAHLTRRVRLRESVVVLRHLIAAAQQRGERLREAGLFVDLAARYLDLEHPAFTVRCLDSAGALYRRAGSFPLHTLELHATIAFRSEEWAGAVTNYRWAAREATQRRDDARLVSALLGLGRSHAELDQPAEALDAWERAVAVAEGCGDLGGASEALARSALLWSEVGDTERAGPPARAGLDLARRSGDVRRLVYALTAEAFVCADEGATARVDALLDEALDLTRSHPMPDERLALLDARYQLLRFQERAEEADRVREEWAELRAGLDGGPSDVPEPPPVSPARLDRRALTRVFVLPGLWTAWSLGVTVLFVVSGYTGRAVAWGCYTAAVGALAWANHRDWSMPPGSPVKHPWMRLGVWVSVCVAQFAVLAVDSANPLLLPAVLCYGVIPWLWYRNPVSPWGARARLRLRLRLRGGRAP